MNPNNLEPIVDMGVGLTEEVLRMEAVRREGEMLRRQNAANAYHAFGIAGNLVMPEPFDMEDFEERDEIGDYTQDELKEILKKKHLNRIERDAFHRPKSDWSESPSGEVCKNAETLVVSDIIKKYSKK